MVLMILIHFFVGGGALLGCEVLLLEKVEKGKTDILVRFVLALEIRPFDLQWESVVFVQREEALTDRTFESLLFERRCKAADLKGILSKGTGSAFVDAVLVWAKYSFDLRSCCLQALRLAENPLTFPYVLVL